MEIGEERTAKRARERKGVLHTPHQPTRHTPPPHLDDNDGGDGITHCGDNDGGDGNARRDDNHGWRWQS
jgi:hypothetical protein